MATNEIYKFGKWLSFPLPLRGSDPSKNDDPTMPGDPVLIGSVVGFAQEVGGKPITWPSESETFGNGSTVSWTLSRNPANSLEPGWASVALIGAFAYPVEGWDPYTMGSGTPVGIVKATATTRAKLVANTQSDAWFGYIVGQTKEPMLDAGGDPVGDGICIPIVNVVQSVAGLPNTVADKISGS